MRPSSEALLCASLINNKDVSLAGAFGVLPDHFVGYQSEYRWILSFNQTYGSAPTKDALLSRFPEFPFTDATDTAFASDEVRHASNQRQLRQAVRSAAIHIGEGDYEEAAMALSSYTPIAVQRAPVNALHDMSFLESWDDKPDSMSMPWKTLQNVTGGCRPGDLWYIAARTGMGKSWNSVQITADALMAGRKVNLYSLEMPKAQVLTRLHVVLGHALGIPVDHVAMRDKIYDVIAYRKLVNRIRDEVPGEVFMFDASDGKCSPVTVGARAGDVDMNIIDYIGLMSSPMGGRAVDDWRVIASISNELKEIAAAKGTRMLALAQINREGATVGRYPPKLKNLAQSDALGQDGDVVLTQKQYSQTSQIFSIEKNRSGASGLYYYARFLPNEGVFHEISREAADDLRDQEGQDAA